MEGAMRLGASVGAGLMISVTLCGGCAAPGPEPSSPVSELRERIRTRFPGDLPPPPIPEDNPQTPEKVALGEALFFDPNLSSCGAVACATCHLPDKGLSDGRRISEGCDGVTGRRNSSSLYQSAYAGHLFWDGRARSLEEQALDPVVAPDEMANTWENVVHYLATGEHPVTEWQFPAAAAHYGRLFDRVFAGEITPANVAKALAAYQRTMVSRDSPYDRWIQGDDSALSPAQQMGAAVFFGRGMCSECHSPPHFTDFDFHNVAVPRAGFETAWMFPDSGRICGGIAADVDPGRAEAVDPLASCADVGRFRTPTLRNVALSPPYMHNGVFSRLEDVILHYWNVGRGTTEPLVGALAEEVRLVMLTDFGGRPDDIVNLTEFLKALTGSEIRGPARGIAPPGDGD
jgi:cytochrome c peroxidase